MDMNNERFQHEYLKIALQYYVAGRSAIFSFLIPVAGNLFHHAIEMFLKFLLLTKYSPKQLRDKYGHDLGKLWRKYKLTQEEKSLNKFNSLIKKLNKMEDLRYPNNKGYAFYIDTRKKNYSYSKGPQSIKLEEYRLNLEQIDEFIFTILNSKVNPNWIKASLIHGDSRTQYERENLHKIY